MDKHTDGDKSVNISAAQIPESARYVIDALEAFGYEAWIVGGWVRDVLLQKPAHDVDIASSAPWEAAKDVLVRAGCAVHETGVKHGTITVVHNGTVLELTTFRTEGSYSDKRHPDEVRFVRSVHEDLARRDFTVNALAYHPTRGLLDPFGGEADLKAGLIRAVGDPNQRFSEDALRVLRAVRFAARLRFTIEPATATACTKHAPAIARVSQERVGAEMSGLLATGRMGWALRSQKPVLFAAIPELKPLDGFDQRSRYHAFDVLEHTARTLDGVEAFCAGLPSEHLRWAALLHDIEKPTTFSLDAHAHGHFFGHPELGAKTAQRILRRLAIPSACANKCAALVRLHDYQLHPSERSARRSLKRLDELCPRDARTLIFELLDLKRSDALAKAPEHRAYAYELDEIEAVFRRELAKNTAINVRDLAINGKDVMRELGIEAGPQVGLVLESLLAAVREGSLANERQALLSEL